MVSGNSVEFGKHAFLRIFAYAHGLPMILDIRTFFLRFGIIAESPGIHNKEAGSPAVSRQYLRI